MLNVPDLEKRWKRYRQRRMLPYYATSVVIAVTIMATAAYLYFPNAVTKSTAPLRPASSLAKQDKPSSAPTVSSFSPSSQVTQTVVTPRSVSTVSSSTSSVAKKALPATVAVKEEFTKTHSQSSEPKQTVKLAPSMAFMQDFETDVMQYYFNEPVETSSQSSSSESISSTIPAKGLPTILPQNAASSSMSNTYSAEKSSANNTQTISPTPDVPKQMLIQRDNDMKDIQDVIARFKKNKNPALSLFVAKRYYRIGNYQQAYNYALITNELDSNIEDSWLIFAKSLYKLDQKEMAIKTLKTYYDDSGSVKAKITIDQMEKGKLE